MNPTNNNKLPIVIYDCFSNRMFGGNVGGIVLDAAMLETDQMQQIAREINAPVTGFITAQNGNEVSARFFMPGAEIAMCGHVTVGLFTHLSQGMQGHNEFVLKAQAGDFAIRVEAQGGNLPNVMMQLSPPSVVDSDVDLDALAEALNVPVTAIGTDTPVDIADAGLKHLCVHFSSLSEVQALTPDFQKLAEVSRANGVHTVACFSMETEDAQNTLHLRDFCPALGADEVPASGTTNGAMTGYLLRHGFVPPQSGQILAEQGSEIGRPSLICNEIKIKQDQISDLWVGGQAVASIKGVLTI